MKGGQNANCWRFFDYLPRRTLRISFKSWRANFCKLDVVVSVFEFLKDVSGEVVFDLAMAGNGLAGTGLRVLIPIMTPAVPDENASILLDLANQLDSLHAI
jgi:hypothetical protein